MRYFRGLLVVFLISVTAADLPKKSGCPEAIDIVPCKCTNSPFTYLKCENIDDSEVLKTVFERSKRYEFNEVHLEFSTLQFLPREIFEKVKVSQLYLTNVTLTQLFDAPPETLESLDLLHIENTKILRGLMVDMWKPLTHLRILNVYYNKARVLGPEQTTFLTRSLQQITFYATQTKLIKPGTFKDLVNLNKVAIDACELTQLTRDIFPVPFNVKYLHFSNNQLTTIPDDMFTDMPNLQTVNLRNNHIAVLPSTSFGRTWAKLDYLILEGNPLICDCRMSWLIKRKPPALSGHCSVPASLKGQKIAELPLDYMDC